ncbi:hypothetical protein SIO70_13630 [Chitinophaga sancti]|uniref:hypothetical protein n=1 Tax=Chitinophaga sancti TaxID=1004 RepID=UPI002A753298|nr:hypothetical protein [Chitinophaga sancti]WPQ65897.1 hypothetical protein SIO70_13630 [Chitinophaga sancti]
MRQGSDATIFWKKYSLLNTSAYLTEKKCDKKNYCRFCKGDSTQTVFSEIPLLPELLGKNQVHTCEECDKCNDIFSDYESHLATFIRPFMTILGIRSKNKVPTFQSRSIGGNNGSVTRISYHDESNRKLYVGLDKDLIIDKDNHMLSILFRYPPYIPTKIYKALVKIGRSLLPKDFDSHCSHIYQWLLSEHEDLDYVRYGFMTTLNGMYWPSPSAELYQANRLHTKQEEYPEYTLVLRFANQVFQIFLPFTDVQRRIHNNKRTLCLELMPAAIYNFSNGKQKVYQIIPFEFGCNYPVTDNRKLQFKFSEMQSYHTKE